MTGRPTLYRSEHCARVLELGAQGFSKAQMAADIGVARCTLDEWIAAQPPFADAMARARDLAMAWWEKKCQDHMVEKPFGEKLNAQLWSRSMSARFPGDYSDHGKLTIDGTLETRKLDPTARAARAAALLATAAKRKAQSEAAPPADDLDEYA